MSGDTRKRDVMFFSHFTKKKISIKKSAKNHKVCSALRQLISKHQLKIKCYLLRLYVNGMVEFFNYGTS